MLRKLRRALTVSAQGRDLAVDLAARHGKDALKVLDALRPCDGDDNLTRDVLRKARRELEKLHTLL